MTLATAHTHAAQARRAVTTKFEEKSTREIRRSWTAQWDTAFFTRAARCVLLQPPGEIRRSSAGHRDTTFCRSAVDISDLSFTFHAIKGPIPALIKKVLCVTREELTFSDSDDDLEHSCITRAQSSSSLKKVNFPSQLHNVLFIARCSV